MKILLTGCCGFIGFHQTINILNNTNHQVIGIDNLNSYYDVKFKKDRLKILKGKKKFLFHKIDIIDYKKLEKLFIKNRFHTVIHLAAQAGVRYSIEDPKAYFDSNIMGFFNILEFSRVFNIKHLIFASTSSVYGASNKFPLKEDYDTNKPLSFYAATKKSNEVMAYSYSNIYKLPTTALRFFTVYGPYGRPDMSLYKFTKAIFNNNKISLFNKGDHVRDFTYVEDIVSAIEKLIKVKPSSKIPFEVYNIGNEKPVLLKDMVNQLEKNIGRSAKKKYLKLQMGDVYKTHADVSKLSKAIGYKAKTSIKDGVKEFVKWYRLNIKNG